MSSLVTVPSWCSEAPLVRAGRVDQWRVIGYRFSAPLDEDAIDYAFALVGYFWRKHMFGCPPIDECQGAGLHDDDRVLTIPSSSGLRKSRTRSPGLALVDLETDLHSHWVCGSPIRKADNTRLVTPPDSASRCVFEGAYAG